MQRFAGAREQEVTTFKRCQGNRSIGRGASQAPVPLVAGAAHSLRLPPHLCADPIAGVGAAGRPARPQVWCRGAAPPLRRCAGSHKPFHAHRFCPNAKLQGKRRKVQEGDGEAEGDGGSAAADVQLEGGAAAASQSAAAHAAHPFINRRMRRAPALLAEQHRQGLGRGDSGCLCSSSSTASLRRLETHVWHAKRLAMEAR